MAQLVFFHDWRAGGRVTMASRSRAPSPPSLGSSAQSALREDVWGCGDLGYDVVDSPVWPTPLRTTASEYLLSRQEKCGPLSAAVVTCLPLELCYDAPGPVVSSASSSFVLASSELKACGSVFFEPELAAAVAAGLGRRRDLWLCAQDGHIDVASSLDSHSEYTGTISPFAFIADAIVDATADVTDNAPALTPFCRFSHFSLV